MHEGPAAVGEREAAWRAPLTRAVLALAVYLGISGVWILIDARSRTGQMQVLVHTVAGLAALIPWARYQTRHLLRTWRKPFTHHLLLGWASGLALLAAMASGVWVAAEAALGTRVTPAWRIAHQATGLASFALLLAHGLAAALRSRGGFVSPAAAGAWTRAALGGILALLLAAGAGAAVPVASAAAVFPAGYRRPFGDSPFAPSLARTSSGGAVSPDVLAGSESCGTSGCHGEIVEEWGPSAHRWASRSRFFQAIQHAMAANNGPESTRYCAGCHDPVALFSGAKNLYEEDLSSPGADEGVSCAACHSIVRTDVRGNADYTVDPPRPYLFEGGYAPGKRTPFLARFLVRAAPALHRESYDRPLLRTPELCGACHKQFIDREVNGVGWVQLQNQYDNWRKSHWFRPAEEGGTVADPRRTLTCRECHMRLVPSGDPASGDAADFNRSPGDGRHRSHRFLGANQWMPRLHGLPGAEEQVRLTEEWLRGGIEVPEIADRWATGPAVALELDAPESAVPGEEVLVRAVVTSNKVGHDFPTGPLDIIQSWVEVTATDAAGRTVFSSGAVDAKGFIEPGAFMFKAEGVDRAGNLIDRHNLWEMVGARFRRSLFPGVSDAAEYRFPCPDPASGDGAVVEVRARLRYRKVDQTLIEYLWPGEGLTAPVTDIAAASRRIRIGRP
jgi:hypothetical protein